MKIAVFIDYWNFQLSLNDSMAKKNNTSDERVSIDFKVLGQQLVIEACGVLSIKTDSYSYSGCYIYTSYNPKTKEGKRYKKWATTWLDRQPGINVQARERRPRGAPRCQDCHQEITHCANPNCGAPLSRTVEKGVDTYLVTDLLQLGMQDSYDAAVLATSDADFVPAVQFIQTRGKKIIQAGFPPSGVELATECWGSFDVMKIASDITRK
jgi:uncharacterized LabA/DUF88 family protein